MIRKIAKVLIPLGFAGLMTGAPDPTEAQMITVYRIMTACNADGTYECGAGCDQDYIAQGWCCASKEHFGA